MINTITIFGIPIDMNLIVALLSLVVVLYQAFRKPQKKEPCGYIRTLELARNDEGFSEDLKFVYKGQEIKRLVVSTIFFWNNGKNEIIRDDIDEHDPLRIELKDSQLLDYQLLYPDNNNESLTLSPHVDEKSIRINFNFLNHQEGAVVRVYHTSQRSEDIKLLGRMKKVSLKNITSIEGIGVRHIIIYLLFTSLFVTSVTNYLLQYFQNRGWVFVCVAFPMAGAFVALMCYLDNRKKRQIFPKKFERFLGEIDKKDRDRSKGRGFFG